MRTRNVFVLLFHRQKNVFCRLFFDYRCKDSKNSAKCKIVQEFKVGVKNEQGARKKFLTPRYYNLMFLLFHFFCLTKRNERQRKVKTVAAALPKNCRFGVG